MVTRERPKLNAHRSRGTLRCHRRSARFRRFASCSSAPHGNRPNGTRRMQGARENRGCDGSLTSTIWTALEGMAVPFRREQRRARACEPAVVVPGHVPQRRPRERDGVERASHGYEGDHSDVHGRRGLFGSGAPPAPSATTLPYQVEFAIQGDESVRSALQVSSNFYKRRQDPPPDAESLVQRLEADFAPMIDALWSDGYYNATWTWHGIASVRPLLPVAAGIRIPLT
jgi:hypothetical protein